MNKKFLITIFAIIILLTNVFVVQAQVGSVNYWKIIGGTALAPLKATWDLGSSAVKIANGWFQTIHADYIDIAAGVKNLGLILNYEYSGSTPTDDQYITFNRGTQPASQILWKEDVDKMKFIIAGNSGMTLDVSGNAIITGTASSTGLISPYLRPAFNSTTAIQLQKADGTSVLNVDTTNGNVGIGTTGPTEKLDIAGGSINIAQTANYGLKWGSLYNAFVMDPDDLTPLYITGGNAHIIIDSNHNTTDGYFSIRKDNTSRATSAELFRVQENGNVGIGTTNPGAKLDIAEGAGIGFLVGADNDATTTRTDSHTKTGRIGFVHYTNGEEPVGAIYGYMSSTDNMISFGGLSSSFNAATRLSFFTATNTTTTAGAERMRIDNDGNVGIGTTNPGAKLDINSNSFILETAQTPATSGATCTKGMISWDVNYIYVCTATNTWKRSALSTW